MTEAQFIARLRAGKPVGRGYELDEQIGFMSAGAYQGRYILTWEECRKIDVYNEHAYTRDERYEFASPEEVLAFVQQLGYSATLFRPI